MEFGEPVAELQRRSAFFRAWCAAGLLSAAALLVVAPFPAKTAFEGSDSLFSALYEQAPVAEEVPRTSSAPCERPHPDSAENMKYVGWNYNNADYYGSEYGVYKNSQGYSWAQFETFWETYVQDTNNIFKSIGKRAPTNSGGNSHFETRAIVVATRGTTHKIIANWNTEGNSTGHVLSFYLGALIRSYYRKPTWKCSSFGDRGFSVSAVTHYVYVREKLIKIDLFVVTFASKNGRYEVADSEQVALFYEAYRRSYQMPKISA